MKTKTLSIDYYQFNELNDDAKEKARDWYRNGAFDYEWYEFTYEYVTQCAAAIGIQIDRIYFSGFWSQGDGACFEGSYSYKLKSVQSIKEFAPNEKELHRIAEQLAKIQKKHFYGLNAKVKHSGHYYHSYCTDITVYKNYDYLNSESEYQAENDIIDLLRDFMDWIYKKLENEYEWLNSNEQIDESIISNEYEFDIKGNRI